MRNIVSPLSGFLSPFGQRSVGSLFAYAAAGITPPFVADFSTETYATDTTETTFSDLLTHSRTSNATMIDADGLLKWAPHNLVTYSEQFDNAAWAKSNVTVTTNATTAPSGTATADKLLDDTSTGVHAAQQTLAVVGGVSYTLSIYAKASEKTWFTIDPVYPSVANNITYFNLTDGTVGTNDADNTASIESVGDGWYLCRVTHTTNAAQTSMFFEVATANSDGGISYTGDGSSGVFIWGAHLYRSDLGGMVAVPADARATPSATTYVPTTTAAVYSPRRGNHVYNGSAWVNKGLLHESAAATNLVTYSTVTAANYVEVNLTITDNAATDLGGASTAARLTGSGVLGPQRLGRNSTITGNSCFSWTIRKDSTHRYFQILQGSDGNFYQNFDLLSGVLGTGGSGVVNAGVSDEGDFWRVFAVFNVVTSSNNYLYLTPTADAAYGGGSATSDYADIAFHQVEVSSVPTSYIPTAGATATRAAETLTVPIANIPYSATAMSFQMDGFMTYADTDSASNVLFLNWLLDGSNYIQQRLDTSGAKTGSAYFLQGAAGVNTTNTASDTYSPGINVPFNIASRHGSTFINGAVDGTALTANLTPVALPDLSATDLSLAPTFNGHISKFLMWGDTTGDIGDTGIAEAST